MGSGLNHPYGIDMKSISKIRPLSTEGFQRDERRKHFTERSMDVNLQRSVSRVFQICGICIFQPGLVRIRVRTLEKPHPSSLAPPPTNGKIVSLLGRGACLCRCLITTKTRGFVIFVPFRGCRSSAGHLGISAHVGVSAAINIPTVAHSGHCLFFGWRVGSIRKSPHSSVSLFSTLFGSKVRLGRAIKGEHSQLGKKPAVQSEKGFLGFLGKPGLQ
ncbi:hypothetical protein C8F04DRAFT_1177091 [Mycena alexandri]|uniref:Uncharacterized protein n=1 Tax=Mycena alexandri TaxID=1745969 RepID=A0AAD6TCV9_9AGAR|nr:hypothetical protein C8F04DRAFT_1177091 [Mycena alexandri]